MNMRKHFVQMITLFLCLTLFSGTLEGMSVLASEARYYGTDNYSWDNYGTFTEEKIDYVIIKKPVGSTKGEVYVNGCNFSLTSVSIPATVKRNGTIYNVTGVNDMAFTNYENLEKVTIADGVTYIGGGAFWGCYYLKSIKLPKTLKTLGEAAFMYCNSLTSISFPDGLTSIPMQACAYSGLTEVTISDKVKSVGSSAFSECMQLKTVTLPKKLPKLEYCFNGCRNLSTVKNGGSITKEIAESNFYNTKWYMENFEEESYSADRTESDYWTDLEISVSLDNKKLTDGNLYYRVDDNYVSYVEMTYKDFEQGVFCLLKKNSEGDYLLDKAYVDYGGTPVSGSFYYTEAKTDDFLHNYLYTFTYNAVKSVYNLWDCTPEEQKLRKVDMYTVKYEQGNIAAGFLPEDEIIAIGEYGDLGVNKRLADNYFIGIGYNGYPIGCGAALAYYEDDNGNRVKNKFDVTGPVTLHPVFVSPDELRNIDEPFDGFTYVYSGYYRDDYYNIVESDVQVTGSDKLLDRIMDKSPNKDGFLIIDRKITLSVDDVAKYSKKNPDRYITFYDTGTCYAYNDYDFILVKDGGTLIVDGTNLGGQLYLFVEKGGKLVLKNGTELNLILGVQPGGKVEITDSKLSGQIYNGGTINVYTPNSKFASESFYAKSIAASAFVNSKTGVINLDYGALNLPAGFALDYYPGDVKADLCDETYTMALNDGTINVTGYGHIDLEDGFQCTTHKDAYSKRPVVNNGTINITGNSSKYYSFAAFSIRSNRLINHGTISVKSDVMQNQVCDVYSADSENWDVYGSIVMWESELINDGTIKLDITNGIGLSILYNFFPQDKIITRVEKDGFTSCHSRIENLKGGKIDITTNDGCGIVVGQDAYLINDGTVNITEKSKNPSNASLLIAGKVINNSKIKNDGNIGYSTKAINYNSAKKPLDSGYDGKKWTGNGGELLYYSMEIGSLFSDEGDNYIDIYASAGKRVLLDGNTRFLSHEDFAVMLPANSTEKITVRAEGRADKTISFTTAKSVTDYFSDAYNAVKSGKSAKKITLSMSKGKSTVADYVTPRPIPVGTEFEINEGYYRVLTSDLKGGTVMYTHGWGGSQETINIPDTVKYMNRTFKVTHIAYGAMNFYSSLKSVTIGKNVEYIDKSVFMGCEKLKTITIKSTLLTADNVRNGAFSETPALTTIYVPKKKLKAYKKWIYNKGAAKSVTIKSK